MQRKQEAERKRRKYEIKYYTGLQTIQQFKESSKEKIKENINLEEFQQMIWALEKHYKLYLY